MERIKRIKNPYQDRINALNAKDIEEDLRSDAFLKKSHDPIPNDINDQRFPMTDILTPNILKPEELSMKDLLDQIQIQTILNNNIAPYVKKEIKSEVTQEMIKQFQFESSKPVEINGKFYKFKPPTVDLNLKNVPPPFPNEATYKKSINDLYDQELKIGRELERRRVAFITYIQRITAQYNDGRISEADFQAESMKYESSMNQLEDALDANDTTMASLLRDYDMYEEYKLDHDTQIDLITKENQKNLTSYEDELKSRNTGLEVAQQAGESDEDYAQRMIDTAQTTVDPAQVEAQSKLFLFNNMKDLMNELTPAYKSEAILNTIIQAGGYEKLQVIKDSWPSLKKLLVDTFGNVGRVENTDNIAQLMYNYSMKPIVRPATPSPASRPLNPNPNVSPTGVRPPVVYDRTVVPSTNFRKADIQVYSLSRGPAPNKPPIPQDLPVYPSLSLLKQPIYNPRISDPSRPNTRFYPAQKKKSKPIKTITEYKIPEEVGLSPPPLIQRSKSLEQQFTESGGKTGRPQSQMSNKELRDILTRNGLPLNKNVNENYIAVATAQLLPPRVKLMPREDFKALGQNRMAQYLEDNQLTGVSGGVPVSKTGQPKPTGVLLDIFDKYFLTGSGLKSEHIRNIKDEFAIIDGEIQAGNNNAQLMRDAKKLLKEMVQKKLVTLYEAQNHMKHLRKINKI